MPTPRVSRLPVRVDANGLRTVGDMRAWMRATTDRRLTQVRGLLDPNAVLTPATPEGRPNVTGADILAQDAQGAQWPLHRFIPEDARLRPSTRAATSLDAIGQELGDSDTPITVGAPRLPR